MTYIPYAQNPSRWAFQLRRAREQRDRIAKRLATAPPDRMDAYRARLAALEDDILNYEQSLSETARSVPPR